MLLASLCEVIVKCMDIWTQELTALDNLFILDCCAFFTPAIICLHYLYLSLSRSLALSASLSLPLSLSLFDPPSLSLSLSLSTSESRETSLPTDLLSSEQRLHLRRQQVCIFRTLFRTWGHENSNVFLYVLFLIQSSVYLVWSSRY